jgi:CRISPR-associated endonuclease Cas1
MHTHTIPSDTRLTEARRRERRRSHQLAPAALRRKGRAVVVAGFGINVRVERGRLVIVDGAGRERRARLFSRASHGIARLILLGGSGSISIAALRWCLDLGVSVLCLDRDGRILSVSAPENADARLRRAQALAVTNDADLEIARFLLGEKLRGQERVLERLTRQPELLEDFSDAHRRLEGAPTLNELLFAERDGALAYWQAWENLTTRFRDSDQARIPEHWTTFHRRSSPLTGSPRSSIGPANSLLNLSYALAESEAIVACMAVGLDPGLGVVHSDVRGRASLALDLLEAIRPEVDAFVLDVIERRVFRASDFFETPQGVCRVLPPLTRELAEMSTTWAKLLAPVAEQVAAMLAQAPGSRIDRVPTPLTSDNRRAANAHRRRPRRFRAPSPPIPCKLCGEATPHADRVFCDECAALPQEERYARTLGLEAPFASDRLTATLSPRPEPADRRPRTSRRCKRCGDPVSHRKRVLCDPCFVAFRAELAAQRRPCKQCGEPTPHRKRALCDRCLSERTGSPRTETSRGRKFVRHRSRSELVALPRQTFSWE